MITYFTEKDLISFGNYMISPNRKEDYAKQLEADQISKYLTQVNTYDIQKWAQLEIEANTPKPEENKDTDAIPTEAEEV